MGTGCQELGNTMSKAESRGRVRHVDWEAFAFGGRPSVSIQEG